MKISTAIIGFRNSRLADGYSENTIELYDWALQELVSFLGDPALEKITRKDLQSFMAHMRSRKTKNGGSYSFSSLDNIWKAQRSFFRWAFDELNVERPDLQLVRPKGTSKAIEPFTQEEIKQLLDACVFTKVYDTEKRRSFRRKRTTGPRDYAIIGMLLDTGLRVSEMCRLKIEDVDFTTGMIRVAASGSGQKTKARVVYLGKIGRSAVWKYVATRDAQPGDTLFVTSNGRDLDRHSVNHMLHNLGEKAGVADVHPHRFRHAFATEFLRNGGNIETLQRLLGHSTLAMVLMYAKITDQDAQNAHRRASPLDRLKR